MDILKKAVLLVAIVSISIFMAGCGGEEAAEETDSLGLGDIDVPIVEEDSDEQESSSAFGNIDTEALKENIEKAQE